MQPSHYSPLSVLTRYLLHQFFAFLLPIIAGFVVLYLIVDLFERLDVLLRNQASVGASVRYFLFKVPLIVTQIMPAAVVTAILLALGVLARHNEILAFRAGGISLAQSAVPLLAVTFLISLAVLTWNETIVPYCSRQFQYVNKVEIRKQPLRGILSDREIWYHGSGGFYNIAHVDKNGGTIFGLVIYALGNDFRLERVIEVERAVWRDGRWQVIGATEHRLAREDQPPVTIRRDDLVIPETLEDFLEVRREPEELSFLALYRWVTRLKRKGIDASHYLVALHLKLALPFASVVLSLVGMPIAGRVCRHPSVAAIVGLGAAVGFSYWVLLGLSNSLGLGGTLPPLVAAWAPNAIFTLIAVALFLYAE